MQETDLSQALWDPCLADAECKEAWVTVLADDAFLPGVLVLLHSIRQVNAIEI